MDTNLNNSAPWLEEDRTNDVLRSLQSLGIDLSISADKLQVQAAQEYLQFGVVRRLSIIRLNLQSIYEIAYPNRKDPLDLLGESASLSMHLHSFFYHSYGALDNAAWSFAYECGFLPKDASWRNHKFEISFYGKTGLSARIREHHDQLHMVLEKQKATHNDMKKIRDAIAHRIPLYTPSAITQAQREEQVQLYEQAEKVGPHDKEYFSLREKADKMGFFKPWFHVEGDPYPQYDIRMSLLEVSKHLLTILDAVKNELSVENQIAKL